MKNNRKFHNSLSIMVLCASLIISQSGQALAWDHRASHSDHSREGHHTSERAYFHPYYSVIPLIGGLTYLYCQSMAQRQRETTYVVVPAPTSTFVIADGDYDEAPADILEINIPNSNGTYTKVTLRRSGNSYIGPQGEYYRNRPTVKQLKALYGH